MEKMNKQNKVLFVDDEPSVLRSLSREFFDAPFEIIMAKSADEALKILQSEKIDLIVTDVKMPGMNGVDLLERIKEEYPDIGRMVLSGYVETDIVTRGLVTGAIVDYYPKPWNDEQLREQILNYLSIRNRLQSSRMLEIINKISNLPVLPEIYKKFIDAIKRDDPVHKIAAIVEQDASIATKVLQLANSAFYSTGKPAESVQQAIVRLGLNLVKEMILSIGLFNQLQMTEKQKEWVQAINVHSGRVNKIFQILYQNLFQKRLHSSLGLLHDVGQVLMAVYFSEKYEIFLRTMHEKKIRDFSEAEKLHHLLPITHSELGGYFLSWWNLPILMVEAALYHHHPDEVHGGNKIVITLLAMSDQICKDFRVLSDNDFQEKIASLGFSEHQKVMDSIREEIEGEIHE
jgi:HD-like signal output (HDOD) protein/CheY-like chemotaxis protein